MKGIFEPLTRYKTRDLCCLEPLFSQHLHAMTEENLRSKSRIAAELAVRDARIEQLSEALRFYARREHVGLSPKARFNWGNFKDTPMNWLQRSGTTEVEMVESGAIAKAVLLGAKLDWSQCEVGRPPAKLDAELQL